MVNPLSRRPFRILISIAALMLAIPSVFLDADNGRPHITSLDLEGAITPVQVEYLERGFEQAVSDDSDLILIKMDTPGGLDTSMREIVKLIDGSEVPVAVYVIPGGRAASAGFYITISADIAAMAPKTSIGSATPVALGDEGEADPSDDMQKKILNDAISYARSLAEARDRNPDWAELAVREAASASANEALELNVIDIVASNIEDLLNQLDGLEVTRPDGSTVVLNTYDAFVNEVEMTFMEGLLLALTDPNIAYILLSLAILGINVEIFNPGLIFPGVLGAISGLMAFYSLGVLPVNYAGILLMVLAFALFITEAFTPTFGLFTAGGIVSFTTGSLILFKGGPLFSVNPWLIAIVVLLIAAFLIFVIQRVVVAHRHKVGTGSEAYSGRQVPVHTQLNPEGTVFFDGEIWKAILEEGTAEAGEKVVITRSEGLTLYVKK